MGLVLCPVFCLSGQIAKIFKHTELVGIIHSLTGSLADTALIQKRVVVLFGGGIILYFSATCKAEKDSAPATK